MCLGMGRAPNDADSESLDELASRIIAYRERAAAARRLALAISDKRATTGLIEHAAEFEKKADAIAVVLAERAHQNKGS